MRLSIFLLLASSALALSACDTEKAQAPQAEANAADPAGDQTPVAGVDRSHAGKPAPDVAFEDGSGEPVTLASFAGKPVLVNLWATWCAPCIAELPTLDALAGEDGVAVVAISQDMGGRKAVEGFFAKRPVKALEAHLDPDAALMTALAASTLPTTILYDSRGREVWRWVGEQDWTSPAAKALIAEAK